MARQLSTPFPAMALTLQPRWDESKQLRDCKENIKIRQTVDYDRYHRAQPLSTLCADEPVWVQDVNIGDTVVGMDGMQASFVSCTDLDDMSTNKSMTSGADAERDTRTDANRESGHSGLERCETESDVTQRCVHFTSSTRKCDNSEYTRVS